MYKSPAVTSVPKIQGRIVESGFGNILSQPTGFNSDPVTGPEITVLSQAPVSAGVKQFSSRSSSKGGRANGKIYSHFPYKNKIYITECSGTLVTGSKRPVVATAAHCVLLWKLPKIGRIPIREASSVYFVPGLNKNGAPFGTYKATRIEMKKNVGNYLTGKKTGKRSTSHDWAFLRIAKAKKALRYVGSDGIVFNKDLSDASTVITGYPGSTKKRNGKIRKHLDTSVIAVDKAQIKPRPYLAFGGVAKGMSGGGWREYKKTSVVSITSYVSTGPLGFIYTGGIRLEDTRRNPTGPYLKYLLASG